MAIDKRVEYQIDAMSDNITAAYDEIVAKGGHRPTAGTRDTVINLVGSISTIPSTPISCRRKILIYHKADPTSLEWSPSDIDLSSRVCVNLFRNGLLLYPTLDSSGDEPAVGDEAQLGDYSYSVEDGTLIFALNPSEETPVDEDRFLVELWYRY